VPFAVSQKGIADGVDIRITHIPRAVQRLLEDDLIKEFKSHFKGHLRKRKAYFLTERGTEKASDLKDAAGSRIITLRTKDGNTYEKKVKEVYEDFGSMFSFFEFYQLCSSSGTLEESAIDEYRKAVAEKETTAVEGFTDLRDNMPEHTEVLGRDAELERIDEWFDDEKLRLLVLSGPRGMGKSAVAAEAAAGHTADYRIFWLHFHQDDGWDKLAYSLAEMASMNNYYKLDKYIKHAGKIVPGKIFELFTEELGDVRMLVVLDNIDSIKNGHKELGSWLTPMLKHASGWKVIITSRETLPVELKSTKNLEDKYTEIKLEGLDMAACRAILRSELSDSEFESIYKYTEGNPLYIKAIREMEAEGKLDLSNFRPEELSLLKYLKMHDELE